MGRDLGRSKGEVFHLYTDRRRQGDIPDWSDDPEAPISVRMDEAIAGRTAVFIRAMVRLNASPPPSATSWTKPEAKI
jgi:hypothetical protein